MSGVNTLKAIDTLISLTNVMVRLNQALQQAQLENRDITEEELAAAHKENYDKIEEFLQL